MLRRQDFCAAFISAMITFCLNSPSAIQSRQGGGLYMHEVLPSGPVSYKPHFHNPFVSQERYSPFLVREAESNSHLNSPGALLAAAAPPIQWGLSGLPTLL